MKKRSFLAGFTVLALILFPAMLFAQQVDPAISYTSDQKFALVIGNGNYTGLSPLANPVNDEGPRNGERAMNREQ